MVELVKSLIQILNAVPGFHYDGIISSLNKSVSEKRALKVVVVHGGRGVKE